MFPPEDTSASILSRIYDLFAAGFLSVLGGSAAYVYKSVKDETGFSFKSFLINAFLSFFIGNMVGNFVPATAQYRDGLLMMAGFSTWPILGILEFYGRRVIMKWLDTKLGTATTDEALKDSEAAESTFFNAKAVTTHKETTVKETTTEVHTAQQIDPTPVPEAKLVPVKNIMNVTLAG